MSHHGYRCRCFPCRIKRNAADRLRYLPKAERLDVVAAQMRERNRRNIAIREGIRRGRSAREIAA